jgi:hypothetical protein
MRKESLLIKNFSKEKNQEERDETAKEIRLKRSEYFSNKKERIEWKNDKDNIQHEIETNDLEAQKKIKELGDLRDSIESLSSNLPKKLWNHFKIKNIESKLAISEKSYEELKIWHDELLKQDINLEENLSEKNISEGKQEAKSILDNFYREQECQWINSDYTKEEISEYFSEENLASLSMEDYILLLRKFPDNMLTHVTRQGIRDHLGHMFHTAGEGEYSDSFMKILEDGKLRSALGIYLVEGMKENSILNFLKRELSLEDYETREKALEDLERFVKIKDSGTYIDRVAIHFATEEVADIYYGSEKGNEIFIAYPSAHIASQYYFRGQLEDRGGGYWNDQWVYANEEKGMDLNAGLVFIPEKAKVDKKTGSRYKLDENGDPIENMEYQVLIKRVVDSVDFYDFWGQIKKIIGEIYDRGSSKELENLRIEEALKPFIKKIEEEFGIVDKRIQSVILDYGNLNKFDFEKRRQERQGNDELRSIEFEIKNALRNEGILYVEAEDTINSKEFWENYFKNHPEQKPSKIVYYREENPTKAFVQWKEENLYPKRSSNTFAPSVPDFDFSKEKKEKGVREPTAGMSHFHDIAKKVINDYFDKKEKEQVA